MLLFAFNAHAQYLLKIIPVDKDTSFIINNLGIQTRFTDRISCQQYIVNLPASLQLKGFPAASIDSSWADSANAGIVLFVGEAYKLASINTRSIESSLLEQAGWTDKKLLNKPLDLQQLQQLQERLLNYYEETGYPFAKIQLDSMVFEGQNISAVLKIDKGRFYTIDSISLCAS